MKTITIIRRALAVAALAALSGCLISEKPLLDTRNGRAAPLEPGLYRACEIEPGSDPDCKTMNVARDGSARYAFTLKEEGEDEEVTFARFRRIASGSWLAQLNGEEDEDYFYFLAENDGDDFVMAMVVCGDIPAATRKKLVASREMEVDDDATVCTAKSLRAVMSATKAYGAANPIESRSRIVYSKIEDKKD